MADASPSAPAERFTFVDGLRGIAAVAVMIRHLVPGGRWSALQVRTGVNIADLFAELGVLIFFTISGFVIAHSILAFRITPKFFANFVFRRSLRLDPPYLATIFFVVFAGAAVNGSSKNQDVVTPSLACLAAHALYVYPFFGYEPIVGVFWTLCLEVQFYLLCLVLVGFAQRLADYRGRGPGYPNCLFLMFGATAAASSGLPHDAYPWCISAWHFFATGVFVYLFHARVFHWAHLAIFFVAEAAFAWPSLPFERCVSLAAGVALLAGSRTGNLTRWLAARPLQFLGAVSYSLYLTHDVVGPPVVRLRHRWFPENAFWEAACIAAAVLACLAVAWLMWRCIERPSVWLAKKIKPTNPERYAAVESWSSAPLPPRAAPTTQLAPAR